MTPEPAFPPRIALFDLDHTLLDGDSNALWLAHLTRLGLVDAEALARQDAFYAEYEAGTLDIAAYLDFQLGLLARHPMARILALRDAFVAEQLAPRLAPAGIDALAHHRARGDRVAIITATHDFLSGALARHLGAPPLIAPHAELRDGRLTGHIAGPISFGPHKLVCLRAWLRDHGLPDDDLRAIRFYSDSINDLPLLAAVGEAVAVNPDARLKVEALARGWPCLAWRQHSPG